MVENKESREIRYMGHWRTCGECGWSGFEGDCDFGHDDFYCPKCKQESLKLEKIGFMKMVARGYNASVEKKIEVAARLKELEELQATYKALINVNYSDGSGLTHDYRRGRGDAYRYIVADIEGMKRAIMQCWLVTPSIGKRTSKEPACDKCQEHPDGCDFCFSELKDAI